MYMRIGSEQIVCIYTYIYIYIYISLFLFLSLSLSFSLTLFLSLSLYIYIYIKLDLFYSPLLPKLSAAVSPESSISLSLSPVQVCPGPCFDSPLLL